MQAALQRVAVVKTQKDSQNKKGEKKTSIAEASKPLVESTPSPRNSSFRARCERRAEKKSVKM
jgi:hypothetical protein